MATEVHFIDCGQGNMVLIDAADGKTFLCDCNVTGTGARFNIDSVDNSTNVINQAPAEMFQALRDAIKSNVGGADGEQLLIRATELEAEAGKAGFGQKYAAFMELAAHHVDALAPFMPALTQLLIGGVKHLVG